MKTLVFLMMLTMAAVSAGVVYLSINRDPLGGAPHVDVTLDAPPQEEAKVEPAPEATTAAETAPATDSGPLIASPADPAAADPGSEVSLDLPVEGDSSEPLTTTAFPIPESDTAAEPAAGEPTAVDQ